MFFHYLLQITLEKVYTFMHVSTGRSRDGEDGIHYHVVDLVTKISQ